MSKSKNPIQRSLHGVISRVGARDTIIALRHADRAEDKAGTFQDARHPFRVVQGASYNRVDAETWVIAYEGAFFEFSFQQDSWDNLGDLVVREVSPREVTVTVYEQTGGQFGVWMPGN